MNGDSYTGVLPSDFPTAMTHSFLTTGRSNQLTQHNKLVLEFSYYEQSVRIVSLDLSRPADKMQANNFVVQ
jgi:hypothetical protein